MIKTDHLFHFPNLFQLESGEQLPGFQLRYTTLGQLNRERNNVVWVCHALTGSSDFMSWWPQLFSADSPLNPEHYFIICANTLGGCYGSTGPLSIHPEKGRPYFHEFPLLSNGDVVRAFDILRQSLGIEKVHTLIGGSLGGQQVLEWAIQQPNLFEYIVPIACNAYHSPWGIAFNEAQRMAIAADSTWKDDDERAGREGMKAARAVAMLSFRNYETYGSTQAEKNADKLDDFRAATYQAYQGEKLANRFNAFTYWSLTKMMDNHHVARSRGDLKNALNSITAKALIVGVNSDILFPPHEQKLLAEHIPDADLEIISSLYGHDGFLVEFEALKNVLHSFYRQKNLAFANP